MRMKLPLLLALASAALTLPAFGQWTAYEGYDGQVVLTFQEGALEAAGLELVDVEMTEDPALYPNLIVDGEPLIFRADNETTSLVALRNPDGTFQPYGVIGGQFQSSEGFSLRSTATGDTVDFHDFIVKPTLVRNDGPGGERDPDYFFLGPANDPEAGFNLCYVKVLFSSTGYEPTGPISSHQSADLRVTAFDLIVTSGLANALGQPELEGRAIGAGQLNVNVLAYDKRWEHPDGQNVFTPYLGDDSSESDSAFLAHDKDVSLGILNAMTSSGHVGSFPNGRTGLSMATTSCNVGDVNVPWLKAENVLQEDHPGIGMNLLRRKDYDIGGVTVDRFESVGVSWVKHGFFALSNSQCTPCQNFSNGTFLGVGCSDTYGTSNNSNRFWLGPRDEWDPHAGTWEADGSFFDGLPANDNLRNENGGGLNSIDHKLEAFDSDLNNPNSDYYYESIYLVRDDVDINNNIGSRRTTMSWTGSSWNFSTPGSNPLIEGPALRERWGDVRTTRALQDDPNALPGAASDDGNVVLSSKVTDLGNGSWRYEYALYNWTLDRRVNSFSVPAFNSASNFYFHDIDEHASNDWTVTQTNRNITWTFPGVFESGHKVAGPIEWGTIYNFGFTSPFAPSKHDAVLGIHDPGEGGDSLAVLTQAPNGLGISANVIAPETNSTINLIVRGGANGNGMKLAAVGVNGVPINPLILTPSAIPFVNGEATLALFVPASVAGLEIDFLGAELNVTVVRKSNIMTLDIQ